MPPQLVNRTLNWFVVTQISFFNFLFILHICFQFNFSLMFIYFILLFNRGIKFQFCVGFCLEFCQKLNIYIHSILYSILYTSTIWWNNIRKRKTKLFHESFNSDAVSINSGVVLWILIIVFTKRKDLVLWKLQSTWCTIDS